jgi:hypothetical protein
MRPRYVIDLVVVGVAALTPLAVTAEPAGDEGRRPRNLCRKQLPSAVSLTRARSVRRLCTLPGCMIWQYSRIPSGAKGNAIGRTR